LTVNQCLKEGPKEGPHHSSTPLWLQRITHKSLSTPCAGEVLAFDVHTGGLVAHVPTCTRPFRLDLAPWRNEIYVHCWWARVPFALKSVRICRSEKVLACHVSSVCTTVRCTVPGGSIAQRTCSSSADMDTSVRQKHCSRCSASHKHVWGSLWHKSPTSSCMHLVHHGGCPLLPARHATWLGEV